MKLEKGTSLKNERKMSTYLPNPPAVAGNEPLAGKMRV